MSYGRFIPFIKGAATDYSNCVRTQGEAIQNVTGDVLKVLGEMTPRQGEPFVIGDYGTADGGTSYELITRCIALLRKTFGDGLAIQIVYEDQPINDFKPIFTRAHGLYDAVPGYMETYRNVFTLACGTSFYSQCVPPSSVDLIFSANAIHRLGKSPGKVTDVISPNLSTGAEREAVTRQAAVDWEDFLLCRAKELKPGGYMALVNPTWDVPEEHRDDVTVHIGSIYTPIQRAWTSLLEDSIITEEEYKNTAVYNYFRSVEEFKKPFQEQSSEVTKSGLRLVSVRTFTEQCPWRHEYDEKVRSLAAGEVKSNKGPKLSGLAAEFAENFTSERRVSNERLFRLGLSNNRSENEKTEILDQLFSRCQQLVFEQPDESGPNYVYVMMVICKK